MPRNRDRTLTQVLSVAQMQAAEVALIAGGTSVDALMERAGRGAGEWVRRIAAGRSVTVLCGPGNNGGDGWVIAQYLHEHGNPVQAMAARDPMTDAARNARGLYRGPIIPADAAASGDVLVDCLFGSGLARPLPDDLYALLCHLAARHPQRIAIDVPSGVESDSGAALNPGLPDWTLTVALGAWKHAHFAMPACATMGALRLVDIGVAAVDGAAQALTRPRLAAPSADAHKYRRGLVGVIGGEMPGAAMLACMAAQRAGAGYVRLCRDAQPAAAVPPELVLTNDLAGMLADGRTAALLVGPGLGRSDAAARTLAAVLATGRPCVVDADALMLLRPAMLNGGGRSACVLTPHDGEMAVLEGSFGLPATGLRRDRARALAAQTGAVVVLKGPDTVIAAPDSRLIVAPSASPWLSVAGTGDVLAGTVASRLATHSDALRAASEGLWLHGAAARLCGAAFTAGELAQAIRPALQECL